MGTPTTYLINLRLYPSAARAIATDLRARKSRTAEQEALLAVCDDVVGSGMKQADRDNERRK